MMRGTFANIRIKNEMLGGEEGGNTLHQPSGTKMPIYDAAMKYREEGVPLVIFAGKEYGTGSSRATGRRRAPTSGREKPSSPRASSVSIARTWSAWRTALAVQGRHDAQGSGSDRPPRPCRSRA